MKELEVKVDIGALLDAIKAFDNLWRQALYLKMKKKDILLSAIILLRIYYDKLEGKIKINDKLSTLFSLKRGVICSSICSKKSFLTTKSSSLLLLIYFNFYFLRNRN